MTLPTIETVRPALSEFELRIRSVFDEAWAEWSEVPDRGRFSKRSRASMVFDFIRRAAEDEFDSDADIHVIPKGQTVQFLFKDKVLVRFKKANSSGLGSNIETQAVLDFIDSQLTLPDLLPEIIKVEVCYHLDHLATSVESIAVTARQLNRKLWSYEIAKPDSAEIVPLPPRGPDFSPPEVRIRKTKPDTETGE